MLNSFINMVSEVQTTAIRQEEKKNNNNKMDQNWEGKNEIVTACR